MVRRRTFKRIHILAALLMALSMIIGLSLAVNAQEEEETPTMEEDYIVELNSVGDGHIVDTIEYDEEDYEIVKELAEESKGFLTRRYSAVDFTGELVDFKTDFDDEASSVIITYDMPGYAYNSEGSWMVYGFPEKPEKEGNFTFTTTETSTINSEFTLFTDQVLETTSTIKLPGDARNAEYDSHEQAITYETTPPGSSLGFWSENKSFLLLLFGASCAVFMGLLVFVATRKTRVPGSSPITATPGGEANANYPMDTFTPSSPKPAGAAPPPGSDKSTVGQGVKEKDAAVYCTSCGRKVPEGKQFCTYCGKPLNP